MDWAPSLVGIYIAPRDEKLFFDLQRFWLMRDMGDKRFYDDMFKKDLLASVLAWELPQHIGSVGV